MVTDAAPPSATTVSPPTHIATGGSTELVAASRDMAQQPQDLIGDDRATTQCKDFNM